MSYLPIFLKVLSEHIYIGDDAVGKIKTNMGNSSTKQLREQNEKLKKEIQRLEDVIKLKDEDVNRWADGFEDFRKKFHGTNDELISEREKNVNHVENMKKLVQENGEHLKKLQEMQHEMEQFKQNFRQYVAGKCESYRDVCLEIHGLMDVLALVAIGGNSWRGQEQQHDQLIVRTNGSRGYHEQQQRQQNQLINLIYSILNLVGRLKGLMPTHSSRLEFLKGDEEFIYSATSSHVTKMWELCINIFENHHRGHLIVGPVLADAVTKLDESIRELGSNVEGGSDHKNELLKKMIYIEDGISEFLHGKFANLPMSYTIKQDMPKIGHWLQDDMQKFIQSLIDSILPPWKWDVVLNLGTTNKVEHEQVQVNVNIQVVSKRGMNWSCLDDMDTTKPRQLIFSQIAHVLKLDHFHSDDMERISEIYAMPNHYFTSQSYKFVAPYIFLKYGCNVQELQGLHRICVARLGRKKGTLEEVLTLLRENLPHTLDEMYCTWAEYGGNTNPGISSKLAIMKKVHAELDVEHLKKIYISTFPHYHDDKMKMAMSFANEMLRWMPDGGKKFLTTESLDKYEEYYENTIAKSKEKHLFTGEAIQLLSRFFHELTRCLREGISDGKEIETMLLGDSGKGTVDNKFLQIEDGE
jgi:gas vesicle protein